MPHASTQQPAATAPLRLLWYAKDVRHPFPGITRVVVPLAGGPPPADAEARLTDALERAWVTPPAGRPFANAIAVSLDMEPRAMEGRAYWLVLVISSAGNCASLHIDRMARHLRAALNQVTAPTGAQTEARTTPPAAAPPPDTDYVRELLDAQVSRGNVAPDETRRAPRVTELRHAQRAIRAARLQARGTGRPRD